MTNIYVRNRDLGFWTQQELPVVRYEVDEDGDKTIVWCNHAGAEEETETVEHPRIDEPDIVYTVKLLVCHKCEAWKREGDDWWEDAPFEGIHQERFN